MKLKEGDTLTVPKGWEIYFKGNAMHLYHKNYSADSMRGFSFYAFFKEAAEEAGKNKNQSN